LYKNVKGAVFRSDQLADRKLRLGIQEPIDQANLLPQGRKNLGNVPPWQPSTCKARSAWYGL